MRTSSVARPMAHLAARAPGLKRLPVLKVLAAAEVALLAREHMMKLDRQQRRRLFQLIRAGRGNRRLSEQERDELAALVATMEPRLLVGHAVKRLSPVPLPRRFVYGARRR